MKVWLKKRDYLKLSAQNDFLKILRMEEGTHEELLNLVGPKFQKQDTHLLIAFSCYNQILF